MGSTKISTIISRSARLIVQWQPLTARGAVALALATIALFTFAFSESDLVAYICGGAIIMLLLALCILGLLKTLQLRRTLVVEAHFAKDPSQLLSKRPVSAGIVLKNLKLFPFFHLIVERKFNATGVKSAVHLVRGGDSERSICHLLDDVTFPHRGAWELNSVRMQFNDYFGFTSYSFTKQLEVNVDVSAPTIVIRPLPVVAASSRAGDQLSHALERSGDLFDIKPYDPSDGVKRILWKTFAHSGELVVRRPEPAVIPEGEVAIYLVADSEEDHVAGALQSYLQLLWQGEIITLFGTDGAESYAHMPEKILSVINHSVWSSNAGSGSDFASFCNSLKEASKTISQVVLFLSDTKYNLLGELEAIALGHNIKITAAIVPAELARLQTTSFTAESSAARWLKTAKNKFRKNKTGKLSLNNFHSAANIIICESQELQGNS